MDPFSTIENNTALSEVLEKVVNQLLLIYAIAAFFRFNRLPNRRET